MAMAANLFMVEESPHAGEPNWMEVDEASSQGQTK
jgi:hypothetical protein